MTETRLKAIFGARRRNRRACEAWWELKNVYSEVSSSEQKWRKNLMKTKFPNTISSGKFFPIIFSFLHHSHHVTIHTHTFPQYISTEACEQRSIFALIFFLLSLKRGGRVPPTLPRWHPCKSHPAKSKSHLAKTKSAGDRQDKRAMMVGLGGAEEVGT